MDILDRLYLVDIVRLENFIKELVRSRVGVAGRSFVGLVRCVIGRRGLGPVGGVAGGGFLAGGEARGAWWRLVAWLGVFAGRSRCWLAGPAGVS